MPLQNLRFKLDLAGTVALSRPDGTDATPGAMKLRALLVLLATGPGMRRSRAFLQDKLWSSADPARGGASLRQALSELRRALGPDKTLLLADKSAVALDTARIGVDLSAATSGEAVEFADGLDIDDPEFEDWLRDRRIQFAEACAARRKAQMPVAVAPRTARPSLLVLPPVCGDESLRVQGEILTSDIAGKVGQIGRIDVLLDPKARRDGDHLAIRIKAVRSGNEARFQAELVDVSGSLIVWSGDARCVLEGFLASNENLDTLAESASAAAISHLGRLGDGDRLDPERLPFQMLSHFPFEDGSRLHQFREWLAVVDGGVQQPIRLAWRARVELVRHIERCADHEDSLGAATAFSREALSVAPNDGTVLAIAGEVALNHGNVELACELSRKGLERNPANPYGVAIHAQALARTGRLQEGHGLAVRALSLAAGQPNVSWWHCVRAATAMMNGFLDDARAQAELAHVLAPNFRAPLRFLCALRFQADDEAGAASALRSLKKLEPDFSLEAMADKEYPVSTIRKAGLLSVTRSALL